MEPQIGHTQFKEYSGMSEFPGQFYSGIPMLNSQSVQYIDMICQRMTAIAMQPFDSWVKEKYMITNFSSTDENEVLQYKYNSDRANRYPVGMGGGCGTKALAETKNSTTGEKVAAAWVWTPAESANIMMFTKCLTVGHVVQIRLIIDAALNSNIQRQALNRNKTVLMFW